MDTMIGVRVDKSFAEALNKSKWMLEMPSSEIVRRAVEEYWQNHLSKEDLKVIKKILEKERKKEE